MFEQAVSIILLDLDLLYHLDVFASLILEDVSKTLEHVRLSFTNDACGFSSDDVNRVHLAGHLHCSRRVIALSYSTEPT